MNITAAALLAIIWTQLFTDFAAAELDRHVKTQTYSYFIGPQTRVDVVIQDTDTEKSVSAFLIDSRLSPLRLSEQDRTIPNRETMRLFSFGIAHGPLPNLTLPIPDEIFPPDGKPDFISFEEGELNRLLRHDGIFSLRQAAWLHYQSQIILVSIPDTIAYNHQMTFPVIEPPPDLEFPRRRYSIRFLHGDTQKYQMDLLYVAIADVRKDGRFKSGGTASYRVGSAVGTLVNEKWLNVAGMGQEWTFAETGDQIWIDGQPTDLLKNIVGFTAPMKTALQDGTLEAELSAHPNADIALARRTVAIQTTVAPITIVGNDGRIWQWRRDLGQSCGDALQGGVSLYKLFGVDRKHQ